jgi:hypothetical protein
VREATIFCCVARDSTPASFFPNRHVCFNIYTIIRICSSSKHRRQLHVFKLGGFRAINFHFERRTFLVHNNSKKNFPVRCVIVFTVPPYPCMIDSAVLQEIHCNRFFGLFLGHFENFGCGAFRDAIFQINVPRLAVSDARFLDPLRASLVVGIVFGTSLPTFESDLGKRISSLYLRLHSLLLLCAHCAGDETREIKKQCVQRKQTKQA